MSWNLRILSEVEEIMPLEELQRLVWPGCETDILPAHLLRAAVQHGGLLIAAYPESAGKTYQTPTASLVPVGFVFGFPGFYTTPDGPRLMHYSHELGVHPQYRRQGIAFALKRAQWQMIRSQGIDRICWTYDPLLSTNATLNIARLGSVCNTYLRNFYGAMRDELNSGLPSDRFQVDWWVHSTRVSRRLSKRARGHIRLQPIHTAQIQIVNPAVLSESGLLLPASSPSLLQSPTEPLLLVEIPAQFTAIKQANPELALAWRQQTGTIFEHLFRLGYLVTDFVHDRSAEERCYYLFTYGETTL